MQQEPIFHGNVLHIPVKHLLKRYKKESGYKQIEKQRKLNGSVIGVDDYPNTDADFYICAAIDWISDDLSDCKFRFPDANKVHGAFYNIAPELFTKKCRGNFIFDWLRKTYKDQFEDNSKLLTPTECRVRILKMILILNPDAVLEVELRPFSEEM